MLRYDYFERGFSDRPELRYDLATYDRQLAELLDTLGIRQPIDVGEFHAIDGAAHLPHMEQATVVDSLFLRFLHAH